jgi:GT2 family glycosyltransferase
MDDVDLCRRISPLGRLLYWPRVAVTHAFQRGSHRSLRLTLAHIYSSLLYFQRWGWLVDGIRRRCNTAALQELAEIQRRRS